MFMSPEQDEMLFQMVRDTNDHLMALRKENVDSHEKIIEKQDETNGKVKLHHAELYNPDCPDGGLVHRVAENTALIRKLEKSLFRFKVVYTPLIFLAGLLGGQWLEEALRNTPLNLNALMKMLGSIFGG
jgi:hypothetical protein